MKTRGTKTGLKEIEMNMKSLIAKNPDFWSWGYNEIIWTYWTNFDDIEKIGHEPDVLTNHGSIGVIYRKIKREKGLSDYWGHQDFVDMGLNR